ncbi:helix-turn-helix transcriptional regulator [Leeuwenhoekiella aequorea]|uniref:AlpA family transcriptional regulator n=1 Tax=Leeuwenhoekiella aequorea TaxID=283736 RepID=A0A4Q0P4R6_9FLAO|nr:helix-turn-helix domain-containing protein [Leeuwenhoekiella aequorea]RXG21128.1 AlpA family transcriptional regulator [Leeuwenhoekiella aequorea]
MENHLILEKLNRLEKLIIGSAKEILTVEDLINYTGYKRSYIYKLVHNNVIPFSKPNGKSLFFEKTEIDAWLLQNKNQSDSQIENLATEYINKSRKK